MNQREKRHVSQENNKKEQKKARNLTALQSVGTAGSEGGCGDLRNNSEEEKERIEEEPAGCTPESDHL